MTREAPKNIDAEESLLGGVLLRADALDEIRGAIRADDFFDPSNQKIFRTCCELRDEGKPVDAVTVAERLSKNGSLDEVGGVPAIGKLVESVPHAAHVAYYAELIVESSRRRQVLNAALAASEAVYGTTDTMAIVSECESRLHAILESEAGKGTIDIREALEDVFHHLDSEEPPGIEMGWRDLNELYQLQPGNLVYVAARPSMGKTGLAANIVINVAKSGLACLLFSLEQSRVEMASRLLSAWSNISGLKINRMEPIGESERMELLENASGLSELQIAIDDDPTTTVSKIAAKARLWKRRHGLDLLVIDYLQLIEPEDKRINREQQVSVMSRALKKLASELSIPVICLAQLNRQSESRSDKRPQLSDLRESGSLEQDANCVILIHRPEFYNDADRPGEADLIIAKNRNGRTGVVGLQFEKSTVSFRDLSKSIYQHSSEGWPT